MKRKLMVGIIAFCSIFCMASCSDEPNYNSIAAQNVKLIHSQYFDTEVIEKIGDTVYIIRDKNTNILYLVVGGYYSTAMTPIYNEDGTLKIYKGDK